MGIAIGGTVDGFGSAFYRRHRIGPASIHPDRLMLRFLIRVFPIRVVPILGFLALGASAAGAQSPDLPGVVEGSAVTAGGGAPITFALVRLIPRAGGEARSTLTRDDGRFRFTGVRPGAYRLLLERIGFHAEAADSVTVPPGGTVEHTFRSAPRALTIAGVAGAAACYTEGQLERDPELASLWREAQKGMETRRAFDQEYIYSFRMVQLTRREMRDPPDSTVQDTTRNLVVNDPRSRGRRMGSGWDGFGRSEGIRLDVRVPDGAEILAPGFLRRHCLESGFIPLEIGTDSVWEFTFRPLRPDQQRFELRGAVRVDRRTFQVHSMALEYLRGREPFVYAEIFFGNARVDTGILRLPMFIKFNGRPVEGAARVVRRVEGTVEYTDYRYFATPASEVRR